MNFIQEIPFLLKMSIYLTFFVIGIIELKRLLKKP